MSVLIVVAHADDEVLGCGGTIARYVSEGKKCNILVISDGEGARGTKNLKKKIKLREIAAKKASKILGVNKIRFLNLPDNQLDNIKILLIIKKIEKVIKELQPKELFTHFDGDLNIDHRIVSEACLVAGRPYPGQSIKSIYQFETPSSTDWGNSFFSPNVFIDVSKFVETKIKALEVYNKEIRKFPHSRSFKSIESLLTYRGTSVGVKAAEAFQLVRQNI